MNPNTIHPLMVSMVFIVFIILIVFIVLMLQDAFCAPRMGRRSVASPTTIEQVHQDHVKRGLIGGEDQNECKKQENKGYKY